MTDEIVDETNRELRGHVFYPPADAVEGVPGLYETKKVPLDEKVIHLHFSSVRVTGGWSSMTRRSVRALAMCASATRIWPNGATSI